MINRPSVTRVRNQNSNHFHKKTKKRKKKKVKSVKNQKSVFFAIFVECETATVEIEFVRHKENKGPDRGH